MKKLILNACSNFIVIYLYFRFTFRTLGGLSRTQSIAVLAALYTVFNIPAIFSTNQLRKDSPTVFGTLLSVAVYSLLSYGSCDSRYCIVFLSVFTAAVLLCLFLTVKILAKPFPEGVPDRYVIPLRKDALLRRCKGVVSVLLIFTLISVTAGYRGLLSKPSGRDTETEQYSSDEGKQALESHAYYLSTQLEPEHWNSLSEQSKLEVLQVVSAIESERLGLPFVPRVKSSKLNRASRAVNTLGEYSDTTREIRIDKEVLDSFSPLSTVGIVCHESYHALQYRMVEAYGKINDKEIRQLAPMRIAAVYSREFDNYVNSPFEKYYSQTCEVTAREYEASETELYRALF